MTIDQIEKEVKRWKAELERTKTQTANLEGQIQSELLRLEKEIGTSNVEEAHRLLEGMKKEREALEQSIESLYNKLTTEYEL